MIPIAKPYIGEEEKKVACDVLESGMLTQGKYVKMFEDEFSKFCNVKHSIMISNGTTALMTILKCMGIGEGDEVITSPFTFIATANAIILSGAKPVFVDIEEDTFNIDCKKIESKINEKTKAIISVDLYGLPCDYSSLNEISRKYNLKIIEDSCQAIGAEYLGKKTGSLAYASAFSLYATKNITCGEGGIITTNDDDLYKKIKLFINQGQKERYEYEDIGTNYRVTDFQAAIAFEQLKKIDYITKKRRENAEYMIKNLENVKGIILPKNILGRKHVFNQFTLRILNGNRDNLLNYLKENGVVANIYYPSPLHLLKVYSFLSYELGDLPVSEKISKQVLSIPVHPSISEEDLKKIVETIKEFKI